MFICECGQRAIICFIEVVNHKQSKTYKCEACFNLDKPFFNFQIKKIYQKNFLVSCSNCNTNWQTVLNTKKMGCPQCYQAFKNTLILYLKEHDILNPNFASSFHLGLSPYSNQTTNPIIKLLTLKEALKELLKVEEYEQAAIIRDQIQELKNQGFSDD